MVADETELAEVIGKTSEVIGNTPEVGVKNAEVKVKSSEVKVKSSEVGVKKPEVMMGASEVGVENQEVGVKTDFEILMGAYRSDFRENVRKVLLAFAENPEMDFVRAAQILGISENSVWRSVRALREVGLLVREGATKGSRWIVKPGRR